jgi:hypothetical protein
MTRNNGGLMFVLISLVSWPKETTFFDRVITGDEKTKYAMENISVTETKKRHAYHEPK